MRLKKFLPSGRQYSLKVRGPLPYISPQSCERTLSTAGLMELSQKIVKIHDIVGTKPIDMACCISQMRDNRFGRLRKFHDDTLISSRKFKQLKVRY